MVNQFSNFTGIQENKDTSVRYTLYILSDFQKNITDLQNVKKTPARVILLPLKAAGVNNLFIDSVWYETPSRKYRYAEELFVKIINHSNETYSNIPAKLFINDTLKAVAGFNIAQGSDEIITLSYTNNQTGIQQCRIEITDYPIVYDNTFYFSYSISPEMKVLAVNEKKPNLYISQLLKEDDYIRLYNTASGNINYSEFGKYHTIILNQLTELSSGFIRELIKYMQNGGSVILNPDLNEKPETYHPLFREMGISRFSEPDAQPVKLKYINYQSSIFSDAFAKKQENIDLPEILKHFRMVRAARGKEEVLLAAENNDIILAKYPSGQGDLYVFTASLDTRSGDFVKHPVFVPTIYNIILNSLPSPELFYHIGRNEVIEIDKKTAGDYEVFHITEPKTGFDLIPAQKSNPLKSSIQLIIENNINMAGNYLIKQEKHTIQGVSFNYQRRESVLEFLNKQELNELVQSYELKTWSMFDPQKKLTGTSIQQMSLGKQLWKWLVVLVLIFIGAEIALIRLLK